MRLFYDQYSSRWRGEALLVISDMLAMASAVLFATGAARSVTTQPWDVLALVIWACIPRAMAKLLALLERPGYGFGTYGVSLGLALVTAVLIVSGWQTLESLARGGPALEIASALPIFLAWCSGMALFHARAYRLHDFVIWSVVLVGLKDARDYPHVWLPIFVGSALLSSTVRHLLNDKFQGVRRPLLNLQNARTSALIGTLLAALGFWATYAPVHGGFDFALGAPPEPTMMTPARLGVELEEGNSAGTEARGGARPATRLLEQAKDASKAAEARRSVGFTYKVALRDLSLARFDPREVLRVKLSGGSAWTPEPNMHWKAISFSRYSAPDESWAEDTEYTRQRWPSKTPLRRETPVSTRGAAALHLECRFVTPILRSLPLPYFTSQIGSKAFHEYRDSGLGDIFPYPPPARSTKYTVDAILGEASAFPRTRISGRHPEARHLEVPPAGELGLNLESLARGIFEGTDGSIADKIQRLRQHFSKGFKYSNNAVWRAQQNALAVFLRTERIGNCTYFATATALLLRTVGVSTRLAAGFSGARWDEETGEAVILNQTAHAWTEVYFPGEGWHPVDATSWVPVDSSYKAPDDAVELMRDMLRHSAQPEGAVPDPFPERPPPLPPSTAGSNDHGPRQRQTEDPEREVSGDLPEGVETDPDDTGSWIEYGGEIDGRQRGGTTEEDVDAIEVPADDDGTTRAPGAGQIGVEELDDAGAEAGETRTWDLAQLHLAFRAVIVAVGLGVLALLVAALLRRKSSEEEDSEGEDSDSDPTSGPASDDWLATLDETGPLNRVIAEYHRLQHALERTRAQRKPHQTPVEHGRAAARGRREVELAFEELNGAFYDLLYGAADISEERIETAVRSARKLRRLLS